MSPISVGLFLTLAVLSLWSTGYLVFLVVARLTYWACVGIAIVIRLSQTPREAHGERGWQTLASDLYASIPLFR